MRERELFLGVGREGGVLGVLVCGWASECNAFQQQPAFAPPFLFPPNATVSVVSLFRIFFGSLSMSRFMTVHASK